MTEAYRHVAVRCAWHYRGTGVWASERASFGFTVASYPRSEVPSTNAGTIILPARFGDRDGRAAALPDVGLTVDRGFTVGPDDGEQGADWQDMIARAMSTAATSLRTRLGVGWRMEKITIRPRNDGEIPAAPGSIYSPQDDRYDSTQTGLAPPLVAVNVQLRTARRGRSGRGRMAIGPAASGIFAPSGILPASVRVSIATALRIMCDTLRAPSSPFMLFAAVPIVWQQGTPLAAPVQTVAVGDEAVAMPRRQNDRAAELSLAPLT